MLSLEQISKRFEEKILFSQLSYTFPEQGLFLLLGGSGTGKTTLLRMIAGLDTDFSGTIRGGGLLATSFAFQEHRLFPTLTVLGNVSEALRATGLPRQRAECLAHEALDAVGFPEGDRRLRPAALSGGMRQRVSLARAIAVPRPILLLDEPEKELDERLRDRLYHVVAGEARRRLVLLVTHTPAVLLPMADGTLCLDREIPERA